jgi:hypothetical protein
MAKRVYAATHRHRPMLQLCKQPPPYNVMLLGGLRPLPATAGVVLAGHQASPASAPRARGNVGDSEVDGPPSLPAAMGMFSSGRDEMWICHIAALPAHAEDIQSSPAFRADLGGPGARRYPRTPSFTATSWPPSPPFPRRPTRRIGNFRGRGRVRGGGPGRRRGLNPLADVRGPSLGWCHGSCEDLVRLPLLPGLLQAAVRQNEAAPLSALREADDPCRFGVRRAPAARRRRVANPHGPVQRRRGLPQELLRWTRVPPSDPARGA